MGSRADRSDPECVRRIRDVPIINLESAMHHPCQAMADMMTIREKLGSEKKKVLLTWAWHPKPLPMAVPNSFALAAAQFGHDLRIAHPEGYELDEELMDEIENAGDGERRHASRFTNDVDDGVRRRRSRLREELGQQAILRRRRKGHCEARAISERTGSSMKQRWRGRTMRSSCTVCRCGEM